MILINQLLQCLFFYPPCQSYMHCMSMPFLITCPLFIEVHLHVLKQLYITWYCSKCCSYLQHNSGLFFPMIGKTILVQNFCFDDSTPFELRLFPTLLKSDQKFLKSLKSKKLLKLMNHSYTGARSVEKKFDPSTYNYIGIRIIFL